jgi:hypothetical protein
MRVRRRRKRPGATLLPEIALIAAIAVAYRARRSKWPRDEAWR